MNLSRLNKILPYPQNLVQLNKKEALLSSAYILFFASVAFSWRAVSSFSIALVIIIGFYQNRKSFLSRPYRLQFPFLCLLYFLLLCLSQFYTIDIQQGWKHIQMSSGLVFIPLALLLSGKSFLEKNYVLLCQSFLWLISLASAFCLAMAFYHYYHTGVKEVFFYHQLVSPLNGHAIQFSIFILFAVLFAWDQFLEAHSGYFQIVLVGFLSIFLFLLSSKLVIVFYLAAVIILLLFKKKLPTKGIWILGIVLTGLVAAFILIKNPLRERMALLWEGDRELYQRDEFDQGIYFNGIQFRLFQWRLVPAILDKENSWLAGLGPGDTQHKLNEEYRQRNMYTGIPGTSDEGLLNYHTHNQFLQSLLSNGIIGLSLFISLIFSLGYMAWKDGRIISRLWFIFLFLYCFTDAILETQYGILIFSFFAQFSYLSHRFNDHKSRATH